MIRFDRRIIFLICACWLAAGATAFCQSAQDSLASAYLQQHYLKREHRVPMRDGAKLFTTAYLPRDTSRTYPILLWRTPYSLTRYGEEAYPDKYIAPWHHLAREGFIFVFQDVRGRFMSEGDFVNMRPHRAAKQSTADVDESSDTYDTIEWLLRNIPRHNGRVGMWGISYPGFYAAMGAIDAHPALAAVSPQAPIADWFTGDDFHHNGAFALLSGFDFFAVFGTPRPELITEWPPDFQYPTPDGYRFFLQLGALSNANTRYFKGEITFWNEMMQHGSYDDFWKSRSSLQYFRGIRPAIMVVGGWFDAENLYGALQTYRAIEDHNRGAYNVLVMGPWYHGGWVRSEGEFLGDIHFGGKTGEFYKENIELPFFRHYLKGREELDLPEAFVFETGANRWRRFDRWPPAEVQAQQWYFQPQGKLAPEKPAGKISPLFDEYISDPAKPAPFTAQVTTSMPREYMVEDQRFAAVRPDVLVYESDALEKDLAIAGPVTAKLFVSSSGSDCDWVVKLIDVYPDSVPGNESNPCNVKMGGYQMLLRGEIFRAKFRRSYENPQPLKPGEITAVEFTLNDVCHTFLKGHKIMVQVQSSWFPLFDRNPQTFADIYNAKEEDFQKAAQRVYRSEKFPSGLVLGVLKR